MDEFEVAVAGGNLRVVSWPGDGPPVIAVHGITANALSWAAVARALDGRVRLVAPDLRGRAGSAHLPGPYGMAAHAGDMVVLMDHLGVDRATMVGHSMGGFVVTGTAARHPERVAAALLVDGGVPLAAPPGLDVDAALHATIGPAMQRLSMTFPTAEEYLKFFAGNPALGRYWTPDVERYVVRDYTGSGSSCVLEAIRADAEDMLTRPSVSGFPILWAPRGMQDEERGLYAPAQLTGRDATLVPDTNHYTILLGAGASVVADRIVALRG